VTELVTFAQYYTYFFFITTSMLATIS